MCTVIILRRPGHPWPLLLGANRDEMQDRPWKPPARHWPDRADVVAGLDEVAGGTWMGLNDSGLVACILNRKGSLGPAPGKRIRGELVLEALDHADATDAAMALKDVDPTAYRPFNIVIADNRDAWWIALTGPRAPVRFERIPEGLSMFTASDRNDKKDSRIAAYLPPFRSAAVPDPDGGPSGRWESWQNLLRSSETAGATSDAMHFRTDSGFGTSSSALLALPSVEAGFGPDKKRPLWLFASESGAFEPVDISVPAPGGLH